MFHYFIIKSMFELISTEKRLSISLQVYKLNHTKQTYKGQKAPRRISQSNDRAQMIYKSLILLKVKLIELKQQLIEIINFKPFIAPRPAFDLRFSN